MSALSSEAARPVPSAKRASSSSPAARTSLRLRNASTFEKVIVANSAIILVVTAAGWWITQHNPETYHYLIDTVFIALAALVGMLVNFALLRAAFAPLHAVFATIRAVQGGDLDARVEIPGADADAAILAEAFNGMLDRLEQARHNTAAHVLRAQEEERRRLALELHDQTGQSLTALALHATAIAQRLAGEQSAAAVHAQQDASRLAALAQRTLGEVQDLSRQLRPPLLDDLGLQAALRWLAEDARERLGVQVRLRVRDGAQLALHEPDSPASRLPEEVETALFRIVQESLTNAVRHGHAEHAHVTLSTAAAQVTLRVMDDGSGFSTADAPAPTSHSPRARGLGLEGMRERVRLLGGRYSVLSRPGRGCLVRATIPVAPVAPVASTSTSASADAE
jgi:two-component system sensor histidine kinase UhpB